jgi:hypothetical protein
MVGARNEYSCTLTQNTDLNSLDFTLHGGITLVAQGAFALTVENSKFNWGGSNWSAFNLAQLGTASVNFHNNTVDCGSQSGAPTTLIDCIAVTSSVVTVLSQYNAYSNAWARYWSGPPTGTCTFQFDYYEGEKGGAYGHGEVMQGICGGGIVQKFTTFLEPAYAAYAGSDNTGVWAPYYLTSAPATPIPLFDLENNTIVINAVGGVLGPGTSLVSTGADLNYGSTWAWTTATFMNNYIYPVGAFFCYGGNSGNPSAASIGTLTHSGDINMSDGSSISDFTLATCHGHQ